MVNKEFWKGKKIFLTGHTGFKGSWLSLWLTSMGAKVTGYSLEPLTKPALFEVAKVNSHLYSVIGDIRNKDQLGQEMKEANPDIVIHMAAQPLVRESYSLPVETYSTNVMGTVHVFEAVRQCGNVRAVINVTTDKCYENKEWIWGYRENEPLGGYDPYSSSKACSELVTSAYRQSFFNPNNYNEHGVAIASARAGNVIGGGDWSKDRLIPDCIKSLTENKVINIRSPQAIRPWQHVLEPLNGYILLAEKLYIEGPKYDGAWNFGPEDQDTKSVEWIVKRMCERWGNKGNYIIDEENINPHEANVLKLDCSKAKTELNWCPKWDLNIALDKIIEWVNLYQQNNLGVDLICLNQINEYLDWSVKDDI